MSSNNEKQSAADFVERVRVNQRKLKSDLKPHYDFIVCGSRSSGSEVARRLAKNPDISGLLLEAGGSDEMPSVTESIGGLKTSGPSAIESLWPSPKSAFLQKRAGIWKIVFMYNTLVPCSASKQTCT